MKVKVVAEESWTEFLKGLSEAVFKTLRLPDRDEAVALPICVNTLRKIIEKNFDFLPEGEKVAIMSMCGTWLGVGVVIGRSPKLLADLLDSLRLEETEKLEDLGDFLRRAMDNGKDSE